jgi:hypothetical protein
MVNKKKKGKKKKNNGKYFEQKTHKLLTKFNPTKQVLADVRIQGKLSESSRQVDVTLRDPDEYDFIAFECKDESATIGTPTVEGYFTKLMDIGAKKGAIVSNSSFSRGARKMAEKLGIDLLHLVDSDDSAIKTQLSMPSGIVQERVETWTIAFSEAVSSALPANSNYAELIVELEDGDKMPVRELAQKVWTNLGDSITSGQMTQEFSQLEIILPDNQVIRSPSIITLNINYQYRIGRMDITQSEGIYNVQDGSYQTSHMAVGPFGEHIFDSWAQVSREEFEAALPPTVLHTRSDLAESNY